ncbi:MAG: insulinase family protein [Muribaculaceae bacterium]|nr:insulinase family protein [Muribaculaceae bacterium]
MISFKRHTLGNGLRVLHHHDTMTQMVAVNLHYCVGSCNERAGRTGLAHLVEHLMFTGSDHAPSFDDVMQQAGGSSNAWTSVDATNYYEVLPAFNIATAFWLERDRLLHLTLAPESVEVQRSVVIEEFKQRHLNVPYGDLSHLMHELAYTEHPYRWPAVGARPQDIADITRDDIVDFRARHYSIQNAILCVSGNVEADQAFALAEHWLGDIKPSGKPIAILPTEPEQSEAREVTVRRPVPNDLLQLAFPMCGRQHPDFVVCDLISDLLANGKSARFTRHILNKSDVFAELDAAVEGTLHPGLFVVRGRLAPGQRMQQAEELVWRELRRVAEEVTPQSEVTKCANKYRATTNYELVGYLPKATRLCQCERLGDANMVNSDVDRYCAITPGDVQRVARALFNPCRCNTVHYLRE